MAAAETVNGVNALNGISVPRKRLRLSDLPLTQVQRSAIDGLLHTFKKKGEFDVLRKKAYAQFDQGVSCMFTSGRM